MIENPEERDLMSDLWALLETVKDRLHGDHETVPVSREKLAAVKVSANCTSYERAQWVRKAALEIHIANPHLHPDEAMRTAKRIYDTAYDFKAP